ncbi:MAG: aldehyde dehydrogenase family protein [Paenibacillus sp.]|nr:aldehyde dehydrogenase family protein [Paenibacillus sp.]
MNALDKCTVRKEPKGVVLIIGSWNYPVKLLT